MLLEASIHSIRRRVLILGIILIVAPTAIVGAAGWLIMQRIAMVTAGDGTRPASANLTHLTQNLVEICRNYYQDGVEKLKNGKAVLEAAGPVALDQSHSFRWKAKNEITGEVSDVWLPAMMAGAVKLEPVTDLATGAPVVDEINKVEGTPATIFERTNARGDMLRIASSVNAETGGRAIGSYMPAPVGTAAADNEKAKALQDVLAGKTHIGKESVANVSFLAAYQPLKDQGDKVIGMLYTALPEARIREKVRSLALGSSVAYGEIFILEAAGEKHGTALVMGDRSVEGRDLWDDKDPGGRLYIRDLCSRAVLLNDGEVAEYQYQRAARSGGLPRRIMARFAYVPELDWVVGFTEPMTAVLSNASATETFTTWGMWFLMGLGVAGTGLAVRLWVKLSDHAAHTLDVLFAHLRQEAQQLSTAAAAFSEEAERALKETVAPARPQSGASEILGKAARTIEEIRLALEHVDASGESITRILGVVDQITFATNLVMVNAAIQATNYPEGGEPLSGVADELRFLVEQCRKAARTTKVEIEQTRSELEKSNHEVLQMVRDLRLDPEPLPSTLTQHSPVVMLRQRAETLMRLAEGIDRTVSEIGADLGVERT